MVRDPRPCVDAAFFDELDDAREVRWQRVARRQQGHLAPVHQRMHEANFLRRDADEHKAARVRDKIQRVAHGFIAARGVDNHARERAARQLPEFLEFRAVAFAQNGVVNSHLAFAEVQPLRVQIEHDAFGAGQFHEFDHRQANRSRSDYQHVFARLWIAAIHRVTTDSEGFDERELLQAEFAGGMQFARGHDDLLAHPAVHHHAQHFQRLATIATAAPAGEARLAIHVRLNGTAVAGLDVGDAIADGKDFDAEFVTGNARVAEERHLAEVAAVVGAANAHAMHGDERFAGGGLRGRGDFNLAELLRLFELDGFHDRCA